MSSFLCALALLGGVAGAGFASGREIVHFFAAFSPCALLAAFAAVAALCLLFLRLCARMEQAGCASLQALCMRVFSPRLARLCALLFALLGAMTGGAMLAACAELGALTLYIPHAYALCMGFSLLLGLLLARRGAGGVAPLGLLLLLLLPVLMLRLYALPAGEAQYMPAQPADLPLRALFSGGCYGALSAAMLAGFLPSLLALNARRRRLAVLIFALLFGALLALGVLICRRHYPAVCRQALPFVYLSRGLPEGYPLVAACLYAAALSTLLAMLAGLARFFPRRGMLRAALLCLLFALLGFERLVAAVYPALGALCAGLLLLLCFAPYCKSMSVR